MKIVIPVFIFCLCNVWTVRLAKRPFGECLPVTLMTSMLAMYVSQCIGHSFRYAVAGILAVSLSGGIVLITSYKDNSFRNMFFSYGLYTTIIISMLALWIDYSAHFTLWDEMAHWGKMLKEMIRIDKFYSEDVSYLLVHKEYPPFLTLFELVWCKFSLGFSEAGGSYAVHFIEMVVLCTALSEKTIGTKRKGLILILALVFALVLFVLNFDVYNIFLSIFPDFSLPIFFFYAITVMAERQTKETWFDFIAVLLAATSVLMIKQVGIAYFLLIVFFYLVSLVGIEKAKRKVGLLKSLILAVFPWMVRFSWIVYTRRLGLYNFERYNQFDLSKISIKEIVFIICGGGTTLQHNTYKSYIAALFQDNITDGIIKLNYFSAAILSFLLLAFLWCLSWNNARYKATYKQMALLFAVGEVGYAFMMFSLYMFCFTEDEMNILASYQRYMSSFMLGIYLIIAYLAFKYVLENKQTLIGFKSIISIVMIFVVFTASNKYVVFKPRVFTGEINYKFKQIAESIQSRVEPDSKIFIVSLHNMYNSFYINYYLEGVGIDGTFLYSDVAIQPIDDEEYWSGVMKCISRCDYLYVIDTNYVVDFELGCKTEDGGCEKNALYRIVPDGGGDWTLVKA